MRSVLNALSPDTISEGDRKDPDVLAHLRASFRRTIGFSVLGVVPTSLSVAILFWTRSSHAGLVLWTTLVLANALAHWGAYIRLAPEQDWMKRAVALQFQGGVLWGGLPWVAMPEDPGWQVFLAALMVGTLAANVLFASQFKATFYSFMLPAMTVGSSALFFLGEGAGQWSAALVLYSGLFSTALSQISRSKDVSASVFAVRSTQLAEGLEAERQLLREANARLAAQARTDSLTGLANRLDFTDRLEAAVKPRSGSSGVTIAVAYLDLDGFKSVNDTFGHHAGDELLVAAADRLLGVLLDGEVLARFGGDELTVLSSDVAMSGGADALGQRLLTSFEAPFSIEGRPINIGCSIGVAEATAGESATLVLRAADTALYLAKDRGGMRVAVAPKPDQPVTHPATSGAHDALTKPSHAA